MKKFLSVIFFIILFSSVGFALEDVNSVVPPVTYFENQRWGLKDNSGEIVVPAVYKKLIPLGKTSWIAQNKRNKFGLIDNSGNVLVPLKYNHADRLVSKFVKLGNYNDFGVYDPLGNVIVKPQFSRIDILFGGMFLTYRNYKYGLVGYDGKTILDNEFDDIYMPKPTVMRLRFKGRWYELEQVNAEALVLPEDAKYKLRAREDLNIYTVVNNTGVISGYSVLTFSDYVIKLISSISPAHEDTIDELMLSQGAETVSILMKFSWLPKYPVVYARNYYRNVRNPNNGPLSEIKYELKQQIK